MVNQLIQWLKDLFLPAPGSSKRTLNQVSPEEIRRERIAVEQTEARAIRQIEELEKQKQEFFDKGKNAASERQKLQYARKVRDLDAEVSGKDQQLALVSRKLRVLHGLTQLKENERVVRDLGMESVLNSMDLSEVKEFVEKATVEGQFQMDKFGEILSALDGAEGVYAMEKDDAETLAIIEAMNQAAHEQVGQDIEMPPQVHSEQVNDLRVS